ELDDLRPRSVLPRLGALQRVIDEAQEPLAVAAIDPGQRTVTFSKAVRADVLQRARVEDFHRAQARHTGIIRVGAIQPALEQIRSIEVRERLAFLARPGGNALA